METQNQGREIAGERLETRGSFSPPDPPAMPNRESSIPLAAIILAGGRSSRMGEDKALLTIGGVPLLRIVYDVAIALCEKVYVVTPWTERYEHLLSQECEFIREVPLSEELGALKRDGGAEGAGGSGGYEGAEGEKFQSKIRLGKLGGNATSLNGGKIRTGVAPKTDTATPLPSTRGTRARGRLNFPQNLKSKSQLPITNYQPPTTNSPLVGFAQGLSHVTSEWVLLLACDLPRLRVEVLREWATVLDSVDSHAIALLTHQDKGWNPLCGFYRRSCLGTLTQYIKSGGRSFQGWLAQHSVQVLPLPDAQMLFNCNTPADYEEIRRNYELGTRG